jgi:hypothetical protein
MFKLAARAVPGTLLFHTWHEAKALWTCMVEAVPRPRGLMLMPDHVHLQNDAAKGFGRGLAAYARWRNAYRGTTGPVWEDARRTPEALSNVEHARRNLRYLALNPCRARLIGDPLAWAFSTYRDCVGLTLVPVRVRVSDPVALHAYTSGDPTVAVAGTELPVRGNLTPDERVIEACVSELLRVPLDELRTDRGARTLLVQLARDWAGWSAVRVGEWVGLHRGTVSRVAQVSVEAEKRATTIAGDARFPGLCPGDLRKLPGWGRYSWKR